MSNPEKNEKAKRMRKKVQLIGLSILKDVYITTLVQCTWLSPQQSVALVLMYQAVTQQVKDRLRQKTSSDPPRMRPGISLRDSSIQSTVKAIGNVSSVPLISLLN